MNSSKSFSSQFQELEELTKLFESGNLDLETAIPKFENAAELAKNLKKQLKSMETKIQEINLSLEDEDSDLEPNPISKTDTHADSDINF